MDSMAQSALRGRIGAMISGLVALATIFFGKDILAEMGIQQDMVVEAITVLAVAASTILSWLSKRRESKRSEGLMP